MINSLFANSYHAFPFLGIGLGFITLGAILFLILMLAIIALKGYALWYAAKRDEKGWFIALLLVNTIGILEIIYLYFIVKLWDKKNTDSNKESKENTNQSTNVQ